MDGNSDFTAPFFDGRHIILPPLIDAHTHCADAGVKPPEGMSLEELVAPPNGLKHRYLRETPRNILVSDMRDFSGHAVASGIRAFVDFREGGIEGCRMLREASDSAFVMGRPVSASFDSAEVDEILRISDGLALPSVSDMDRGYVENCAEAAHRAGKPFALHVSERIREDMEFVVSLEPAFVVHMVAASDSDMRMCADLGIPTVVCPRSNRYFGMVTPLGRMLDSGLTLAFGTDNAMLCPPDLRGEAALASDILMCQNRDPMMSLNILRNGTLAMSERLGIYLGEGSVMLPAPDGPLSALTSGDLPIISDVPFE